MEVGCCSVETVTGVKEAFCIAGEKSATVGKRGLLEWGFCIICLLLMEKG